MRQVKTQFHVNVARNTSMWGELYRQGAEGGVLRLYRGLLAACLRPQALCMYAGNEWCKRVVSGGSGRMTTATAAGAGWLSGFLEAACVCPFELVKVRMQVKEHVGRFANSTACGACDAPFAPQHGCASALFCLMRSGLTHTASLYSARVVCHRGGAEAAHARLGCDVRAEQHVQRHIFWAHFLGAAEAAATGERCRGCRSESGAGRRCRSAYVFSKGAV